MPDEKIFEIIEILKKEYPDVRIALEHSNPLELLIATILSAQCTDKIEKDPMEIAPKKDWDVFSLLLIRHGRMICNAKKPLCGKCVLNRLCPSAFTFG